MTASNTCVQSGFEPIPGYILREPLGSGGYGEVWLADAPGGLRKAIKIVHGSIDGNQASHELKALQRVRKVNHPFILSLERIEIVDGQLIIVTELAQGSLHDRFVERRQRGFVGIARERLLSYLSDAADGLDFLCQQHDLQHLDVKPGNLLLVADRVKVADFGLIKDIQSKNMSMMGGLTPIYAAPEMFDGRPGRFSDQYSLAIVYQELSTGTLPFRGRTTAQIANEHLHKAPNLESLPLLERPIVGKALSKRPKMRFSDCKEFVSALASVQTEPRKDISHNASARGWERPADRDEKQSDAPDLNAEPSPESVKVLPKDSVSRETVQTTSSQSPSHRAISRLPILEDEPKSEDGKSIFGRRNIYIGVGGTGAEGYFPIEGAHEPKRESIAKPT